MQKTTLEELTDRLAVGLVVAVVLLAEEVRPIAAIPEQVAEAHDAHLGRVRQARIRHLTGRITGSVISSVAGSITGSAAVIRSMPGRVARQVRSHTQVPETEVQEA